MARGTTLRGIFWFRERAPVRVRVNQVAAVQLVGQRSPLQFNSRHRCRKGVVLPLFFLLLLQHFCLFTLFIETKRRID